MAWTYNINKINKTDDQTIEIVVGFDNGTKSFTRIFTATRDTLTKAWLEAQIEKEVKIFENAKQFVVDIKTGAFTLTPIPAPTAQDIAKSEFVQLIIRLRKMKLLVDLGIIPSSDMTVLRDEIISKYSPDYIDDIYLG